MILQTVTFTGVDEKTDLSHAVELAKQFPFVEYGVLLSASGAGKKPRYPSIPYIEKILSFFRMNEVPTALHVCGGLSRDPPRS